MLPNAQSRNLCGGKSKEDKMREEITNKLKGYDVTCGSTHFYFEADKEEEMLAFVGYAILHLDKSDTIYQERVSVRKDYYYEDEITDID